MAKGAGLKIRQTGIFAALAAFVLAVPLAGCAVFDRAAAADAVARPAGLTRSLIRTDWFLLTAYARQRDPAAPLVVYIEGDGMAWLSRTQVSPDPTPRDAQGLRLAALDPSPNVLYLARPCQFTPFRDDPRCREDYWTGRRFAEEVIAAANQAIDRYLAANGGRGVRLVGYSGGGAVAALVAARRGDMIDLRTVAGNLDHTALSRHHRVSPLDGSLNPADVAGRLAGLPQLHLVGESDRVVVAAIAESYTARAGNSRCIEIRLVAAATHEGGWDAAWRAALNTPPRCR
jgi:pimeloyl-ACP methyl ester carboxylesterase